MKNYEACLLSLILCWKFIIQILFICSKSSLTFWHNRTWSRGTARWLQDASFSFPSLSHWSGCWHLPEGAVVQLAPPMQLLVTVSYQIAGLIWHLKENEMQIISWSRTWYLELFKRSGMKHCEDVNQIQVTTLLFSIKGYVLRCINPKEDMFGF